MFLECARIYVGGVPLAVVKRAMPRARKMPGRVYVGYGNASGVVYSAALKIANEHGGWVESEAD